MTAMLFCSSARPQACWRSRSRSISSTIIYAVRGGLTAGEILARTQGNRCVSRFYLVFVLAAAVHAPIGLRIVLREWAKWRGRSLDVATAGFLGVLLLALGLRAALAVYLA